MEPHLFEARINQQGRSFLFQLKKWAMFFYVCSVLALVFDFINASVTLRTILREPSSYTGLIKLEWIVAIIYIIVFWFPVDFVRIFFLPICIAIN